MTETALIVAVQEAEPHVSDLRQRFDFRAQEDVPAHITILHPFVTDPSSSAVKEALAVLFLGFASFRYELEAVQRWPDNLHLRPEPAEPFIALTRAVWQAFPDHPPYEGRFPDVVPHLSVAQGPTTLLDDAEPLLRKRMKGTRIQAECTEVVLIEKRGGTWPEVCRFRLGCDW
jgi:hypothetical protein